VDPHSEAERAPTPVEAILGLDEAGGVQTLSDQESRSDFGAAFCAYSPSPILSLAGAVTEFMLILHNSLDNQAKR
jgi:hypothetical protein